MVPELHYQVWIISIYSSFIYSRKNCCQIHHFIIEIFKGQERPPAWPPEVYRPCHAMSGGGATPIWSHVKWGDYPLSGPMSVGGVPHRSMGCPPPWTDRQSKNITFLRTPCVGGNNECRNNWWLGESSHRVRNVQLKGIETLQEKGSARDCGR